MDKIIRMELMSDLCPASGDGFAGFVDADVCFDDLGLPYIPAKRLKGCLRECGLDILSVDNSYTAVFNKLFGKTGGSIPGTLNISNGKLDDYTCVSGNLGSAERSEIAEVYTSIRSRTKMDNGKVAQGTLRTTRVLNKGQCYDFSVTLDNDACTCKFLNMCVKSLRNLGLNRSRGLGEVKCKLMDGKTTSSAKFHFEEGDASRFSYTLELIEPVISAERSGIPQATESYIFGSAILGAFAVKYIEKHGLKYEDAHVCNDFCRIFLEGGVKFTAAMPSVGGHTYHPTPMVLRTDKQKDRLFDESLEVYDDSASTPPICKRLGGFILTDTNGTVKTFTPAKTAFLHHSRPSNRSVAHANEKDGNFYTYEALAAGQTFAGSVIGNKEDIQVLANLFTDSEVLRIGRSRTAQYGKVKIAQSGEVPKQNPLDLKCGDVFRLVAVTPIILEDKKGINKTDVGLIRDSLGVDYEIVRSVCAETIASGYYGKWLLPRRQERAIAEGSTVVIKYNGVKTMLNVDFIGKRTGEGFGQVRVEPVPESTAFKFAPECKPVSASTVSSEVGNLRAKKKAVSEGVTYGEEHFATAPQNASLSRVLSALKLATDFNKLSELLDEIKQPEKKIAVLCFATGKDKLYFKIDAKHMEKSHLEKMLEERGYEYSAYQKYLNAAIQRVKQKRRSIQKEKVGEVSG